VALLIGIDVGTTNLKAVLYDARRGETVAVATRPTPERHPRPDWSEFDADEVWGGVVACVREIMRAVPEPRRIAGVAVASMGEAGVALDAAGVPLYPFIAWYDPRGEEYVPHWRRTLGEPRVYELTGQPLGGVYGINHLMWLAEHRPDVIAAAAHWLSVEDYILWRLSGAFATDYTIAARTMAFEPARRSWSPEMLVAAGVSPDLFPTPYPSGTRVGGVTAGAADATGLPPGTAIVTGGHDHLCGALTVGAVEPGALLDSTGTVQAVVAVTPEIVLHPTLARAGYASYGHVVPGMSVVIGGLTSGGKMVEWFVDTFYDLPADERYERALAEAGAAPAAGGVYWLPHLLGSGFPNNDPLSRAACVGLGASHTRGAVLRGLVESLGYAMREGIEAIVAANVPEVRHIVAIGGGSRSPVLMRIKADVTGRTVHVPEVTEAVAVGAALLAGLGAGVFTDVAHARASLRVRARRYAPDAATRDRYDQGYARVFGHLHTALGDVNQAVAEVGREHVPPAPLARTDGGGT